MLVLVRMGCPSNRSKWLDCRLFTSRRPGALRLSGHPHRTGTRRAFTLLEMIIAIALTGILTAVGVPSLEGLTQNAALNASSATLSSISSAARENAQGAGHALPTKADVVAAIAASSGMTGTSSTLASPQPSSSNTNISYDTQDAPSLSPNVDGLALRSKAGCVMALLGSSSVQMWTIASLPANECDGSLALSGPLGYPLRRSSPGQGPRHGRWATGRSRLSVRPLVAGGVGWFVLAWL